MDWAARSPVSPATCGPGNTSGFRVVLQASQQASCDANHSTVRPSATHRYDWSCSKFELVFDELNLSSSALTTTSEVEVDGEQDRRGRKDCTEVGRPRGDLQGAGNRVVSTAFPDSENGHSQEQAPGITPENLVGPAATAAELMYRILKIRPWAA